MRNMRFLPAMMIGALLWTGSVHAAGIKLLNVSYDPTRELYQDVNSAFAKSWKTKTGQDVSVAVRDVRAPTTTTSFRDSGVDLSLKSAVTVCPAVTDTRCSPGS